MKTGIMKVDKVMATGIATSRLFHAGDRITADIDVSAEIFDIAEKEGWLEVESNETPQPSNRKISKPSKKKRGETR